MKHARLRLSLELFGQALCLPRGIQIDQIRMDAEMERHGYCELVLSGDDLPVAETPAGDILPEIEAFIQADDTFLPRRLGQEVSFRRQEREDGRRP